MNAPMVDGNSAAEALHAHEAAKREADTALLGQAREQIIDKLVEGENVRRFNARDIFDCALNNDAEYQRVLDLLEAVLHLNCLHSDEHKRACYQVAEQAQGFIERFVDGKDDWIQERAEEMAADLSEER